MKMLRYFFGLLLLFACLFACKKKIEVKVFSSNGTTLIDSCVSEGIFLPASRWKSMAFYPVFYEGKWKDTITLGQYPVSMFFDLRDSIFDTARNWTAEKAMNVNLFIDTAVQASYGDYFMHYEDEKKVLDSVKYYKAFPVFIKNNSDSLVHL